MTPVFTSIKWTHVDPRSLALELILGYTSFYLLPTVYFYASSPMVSYVIGAKIRATFWTFFSLRGLNDVGRQSRSWRDRPERFDIHIFLLRLLASVWHLRTAKKKKTEKYKNKISQNRSPLSINYRIMIRYFSSVVKTSLKFKLKSARENSGLKPSLPETPLYHYRAVGTTCSCRRSPICGRWNLSQTRRGI